MTTWVLWMCVVMVAAIVDATLRYQRDAAMTMRPIRQRLHSRFVSRGDAGFGSLELVIITPVLLVMLLLVVGFGRLTHGRQLVEQAAAAAARAGTLDSIPAQASVDAEQAAHDVLDQAGVTCSKFDVGVDTNQFAPGGQVSVTVTCTTSLSDLGLVGFPGSKTLTASASSPLEQFRQYGDGGA